MDYGAFKTRGGSACIGSKQNDVSPARELPPTSISNEYLVGAMVHRLIVVFALGGAASRGDRTTIATQSAPIS